jgi:NADH-quinone oxidoreductase subunit H
MRAAAQMLSYEVPMGMALLVAILTTGHLRLEEMVAWQAANGWAVLYHPLAGLILFTTALAEANRMPFDLAESEQELVGGYHTEYSALKLAMFFLAEYAHMITSSALMVAMFFGGYLVPGWDWVNGSSTPGAMLCRMAVFGAKVGLFICVYMLIRWTIPRFRFDQLMRLAWKSLVPLSTGLVAVQGVIVYTGCSPWWATACNAGLLLLAGALGVAGGRPVTGRQQSLERGGAGA